MNESGRFHETISHRPLAAAAGNHCGIDADLSSQTDPQKMVQMYGQRIRQFIPTDRFISLSRRDLPFPKYKITRSDILDSSINPWKSPEKLQVLEGGLLGELIYGEEPVIIDDLQVATDDPAAPFFAGLGSLLAIPLYDGGKSINMVVTMRQGAAGSAAKRFRSRCGSQTSSAAPPRRCGSARRSGLPTRRSIASCRWSPTFSAPPAGAAPGDSAAGPCGPLPDFPPRRWRLL